MRIYLDNCCYNRPYDDQMQLRISLETQAKLFVQDLIRNNQIELAASYMLMYENEQNPYEMKKYELDKETGLIILDRILYTSTHYPSNYGFIPRTYGDDGDPLDVLLLCSEPLESLTLVRAYPIGVITMLDSGRNDEKIIAIPFNDPNYNMYTNIDQLPGHIFDEMKHFFSVYKSLENKETAVDEVRDRDTAVNIVADAIDNYIETFCK